MRRASYVCFLLAAICGTVAPAWAGTVYVPILTFDDPGGATYRTRIWLTNAGDGPAEVHALFLAHAANGTENRSQPQSTTVAPGATVVLFSTLGTGLLELQAPATVAVGAELRATSLIGPQEVFGSVPVVGSAQAAKAGETVFLQGMRRTTSGVEAHLGLMNLGHRQASCDLQVVAADGRSLADVPGMPVPALSQVFFEDALGILRQSQIGDVHARISCNRPFFAFLALMERATGEVVFVHPSATGASTFQPPGKSPSEPPGDPPPDPGEPPEEPSEPPPSGGGQGTVFSVTGTFHTPTPKNPTKIFNFDVPKNRVYSKVILDLDVTFGNWSAEPSKMHSLFWLHRGGCCWPKWSENIVGYANVHGPRSNQVRIEHALDHFIGPPSWHTPKFNGGYVFETGKTYHFRYEYDAGGGQIRLAVSVGGNVVKEISTAATTSEIHPPASGKFMAYFGHEHGGAHGPEQPTYGWKYSNLRVELVPK